MADQAIETFAALMARLDDPFADRGAILRASGLHDGDFHRLADRYSKELQSEHAAALAQRYGDAYEAAVRELTRARRDGCAAPDLRFLNTDVQSFRDEAAAVPLQAFGEGAPIEQPPTSGVASLAVAARVAVATPIVGFPMMPVSPSQPVVAPPSVPMSEAVPSSESFRMPEGMRNFKDIHGTQMVSDAPKGPALPFDRSAKPTVPAGSHAGRAPLQHANIVPEGMRGFTDVRGTQVGPTSPQGPSLPFAATRPTGSAPALESPGEPPPLSVEQYASLCVDLAADPTRRSEILSSYRLSEEQHHRVEALWRAKVAADSRVQTAIDQARATYRIWHARRREGR